MHSMVMTGSISWTDASCVERQEELNFPPRKVRSTTAACIGSTLLENFEVYLFGCDFPEAIRQLGSQFSSIGFHCVADSASANLKVVRKLFTYLVAKGKEAGVVATCAFTPCLLHQLMRVVLLLLEQKKVAASLYSITRIQLHTASQQRCLDTMHALLEQRFRFEEDTAPPNLPTTATYFRNRLKEMLLNALDNVMEDDEETFRKKGTQIERLLDFFNGDIANKNDWTHFCNGCHTGRDHAFRDVPGLQLIRFS